MKWALVRKEIAEHWVMLLVLGLVVTLLFGMMSLASIAKGDPAFEVLRRYVGYVVPLAAWFLGGRLVRREYGGRTQLFLDALPVHRSSVVTSKYLVAAAALAIYVTPAFVLCALAATRGHDVTAGLLGIVALRTAAFTWLVHAACFALGFLGRYRTALVLVGLLTFALIAAKSDIEVSRFGPFGLVDHTFPFERNKVPVTLVLECCGASLALTAIAYGLAAVHEGSVAARLAQQMSLREKAFMAILVMAAVFSVYLYREKRHKEPFAPPVAAEASSTGLRTVIGAGSGMTEVEATGLARSLQERLDAMRSYLRIETLPPLFVFGRTGLDVNRYEHGKIEDEEGVVVRVNYPAPGWSEDLFVSWLTVLLLNEHTHWRSEDEERRWVLDGFGPFWAAAGNAAAPLETDERLLLRALYGASRGVTRHDLDRWESQRELLGDAIASAVAWSGLRVLAIRHGPDAAQAFLAEALGTEFPDDFRAVIGDRPRSIGALIERHAGVSYDGFLAEWNAELDTAREHHRAAVDAVPRVSADVAVVPVTGTSRELEYTVTMRPAPPDGARVRFEWTEIGPFDEEIDEQTIQSDDVAYRDATKGRRLPQSFRSGGRIAWRVSFTAETLGCAVVSPVRRTVLE